MQGKFVYIRTKVVGPFLGPCVSRSYVCKATGEYHKNLKGIQAQNIKVACMTVMMGTPEENIGIQRDAQRENPM
jgi:hypothetical protein